MQALFPVALSRNVIYNNTLLPSCRKTFLLKLASLSRGLENLKYRVQLNQPEQCCACCTECTPKASMVQRMVRWCVDWLTSPHEHGILPTSALYCVNNCDITVAAFFLSPESIHLTVPVSECNTVQLFLVAWCYPAIFLLQTCPQLSQKVKNYNSSVNKFFLRDLKCTTLKHNSFSHRATAM